MVNGVPNLLDCNPMTQLSPGDTAVIKCTNSKELVDTVTYWKNRALDTEARVAAAIRALSVMNQG